MPGFRSYLPDCRGYEQVSPPFKDGFPVVFESLTTSGTRLKAVSLGFFAGATGPNCEFHSYDLAQSGFGWITTPFGEAPLTDFAYAGSSCTPELLSDQGAVLLELHPASHSVYERDLYLRQPDGSVTAVGPMLPPSAVPSTPTGTGEQGGNGSFTLLGASADFTHVLFTLEPLSKPLPPGVESELWPGDTTTLVAGEANATASLYEYTGTGNTIPALVGVDNGGHLISDCGTYLGGGGDHSEGNHLNAISADGSQVLFTAVGHDNARCAGVGTLPQVEELFDRVDGSHTIAISEPQALSPAPRDEGCTTTECQANTTKPENFRDANFEGASADGAKVFFTSPQQLLDDATQDSDPMDGAVVNQNEKGCHETAGASGCNLYEYSFKENPATERPTGLLLLSGGDSSGLGPNVQGVAGISQDGSHVYFVAKGVLTHEPRGGQAGQCITELSAEELVEEEATHEGRCRPKRETDNLYVSDTTTGQTAFIATLSSADSQQWPFNGETRRGTGPMNVTDDGKFLVFTSAARLTADESSENTVTQVFRYEAATGVLVRVSIGNDGFNDNGNVKVGETFVQRANTESREATSVDRHPSVSEDGKVVVFQSSAALTPGAIEDRCAETEEGECVALARNVYEYRDGHVYLISDGRDVNARVGGMVSPSGSDIFFETDDSLVPQDTDTLGDVYDARVEGGFPAPATPAGCEGEGCQGAPSTAPGFGSAGSATFSGPGNLPPSLPSGGPVSRPPTRAQKLVVALKACRVKHNKRKRRSCESQARKRYGSKPKSRRGGK